MIIYKTNNVISKFQQEFIDAYDKKYPTHKLIVELPLQDFFKMKEKSTGETYNELLKKRTQYLRIDVYDTTLDKAFELNGEQHDTFNSFFHKDVGILDIQKSNDRLKENALSFYGTKLVNINYKDWYKGLYNDFKK